MRRIAWQAAVVVGFLVVGGAASALIVPQRGIGGVELGMSKGAVRATLGAPLRTTHDNGDLGPSTSFHYRRIVVSFAFDGPASGIETSVRGERTSGGVGVGSTIAEVRAKVAGARCLTESGYRHCYVGAWTAGRVVTDFSIRGGRVSRVFIGRVLD